MTKKKFSVILDRIMEMKIEKSWHSVLQEVLALPYIQQLKEFLNEEERNGETVYPPEHLIFNALECTPFDQVKVVIMGQDPYHGDGQAEGLSFSVPKGLRLPPSLRNIFKELRDDLGIPISENGCLESWAKQGVLMLNATLTVREKEPKSHYGKGWERFTDAIIDKLAEREEPIVFVLWGKSAQEKCARLLLEKGLPHVILIAPHPSPFSAHTGFLGCRHFSKINEALKSFGKSPINWSTNE